MEPNPYSPFRLYLASFIILFIIGWGSVTVSIFTLTPTVLARWLFFFGGTLGLISLALPVTWFLNLRFQSEPPAGAAVIVRQAIWVGVYGALLTWLQQERLVTLWTGLGLAAGLGAIEYLIRMREKSRWQPSFPPGPATDDQQPVNGDRTVAENDPTVK
jgi:hypothetical protein